MVSCLTALHIVLAAAPFEARIAKVAEAVEQLGRTPNTQFVDAIEEELIGRGRYHRGDCGLI